MQTTNYWKQFESTGKIQDYLTYRTHDNLSDAGDGKRAAERKSQENPYAGIHMCDRNDIEADTFRGI